MFIFGVFLLSVSNLIVFKPFTNQTMNYEDFTIEFCFCVEFILG